MTVKKLISELKKMPPELEVYFADHDHSEYEWNNKVHRVYLVDFDNAPKTKDFTQLKGEVVMLR
jgi:hypothetical protein